MININLIFIGKVIGWKDIFPKSWEIHNLDMYII